MDKNIVHILGILEAIEKIFIHSGSFFDAESLFESNDQKEFDAIQMLLFFISDTFSDNKKIDPKLLNQFTNVEWTEIRGVRNRLAHDYPGTNPEILFNIIRKDIPELKLTCIALLKILSIDKPSLEILLKSKYYRHLRYLEQEIF